MKHHRCEVNHPKTTPKKFKRCLPPQRASDRNSVGASAGHRTAGLGAPGSLQNLIVRHHFSPSKRFKEASNRQKVLTPVFFHEFFTHEKTRKKPSYNNILQPHLLGGNSPPDSASATVPPSAAGHENFPHPCPPCAGPGGVKRSAYFSHRVFMDFHCRKIMKNMGLYGFI